MVQSKFLLLLSFFVMFSFGCKTQKKAHPVEVEKVPPSTALVLGKVLDISSLQGDKAMIVISVEKRLALGAGFVYDLSSGQKINVRVLDKSKISDMKKGETYRFLIKGTDSPDGTVLTLVKFNKP